MAKKAKTPEVKAHSRIGASSYERWGTCPASVRLSKYVPKTSSSYADEGTKAHDLAEKILRGEEVNLSEYDDEMIQAVMEYVDFIRELSKDASHIGIEERFELTDLHPDLFGTADAVIYKDKILYVCDYKHGKGLAVDIEGNKQLQFYALGALMKLKLPCSEVEMIIVQPRAFHPDGSIRRWRIPVIDLLDFSAQLVDDALATENPNAAVVSGDHCRFCPAAPTCPELHSTALKTAEMEFSPSFSYDPEKLSFALSKIGEIKAWAKSVEEFAFREAQAGRIPPGYKLVPKRATRKWIDEGKAETILLMEIGLAPTDIIKEPSLKSPAQVEALLSSKEDKKLLESIVSKESSGDTLAPVSDKRKNSKPAVETEFTKIEG